MVCQWLATGRWFSLGPPVSSNKTDHHNITEILLKVALNTIKQTSNNIMTCYVVFFKGELYSTYKNYSFISLLHIRDSCNSTRRVMDSTFSVETRPSFQILDFYIIYNGGTHQNFQKCLLDTSKLIATSKPDFLKESCVFGFTCKTFGHSFQT